MCADAAIQLKRLAFSLLVCFLIIPLLGQDAVKRARAVAAEQSAVFYWVF